MLALCNLEFEIEKMDATIQSFTHFIVKAN